MALDHEQLLVSRGKRSGLPIAIAVHSTLLGPALGGCRLWHYPSWRDGVEDVLRLSSAMTVKCAVAGLASGGGKTVVVLSPGQRLDRRRHRSVLLDLGDLVESLDGAYRTAEDVGTTIADMRVVRERTAHVVGLVGDPAASTAKGVYAAFEATIARLSGGTDPAGLRVTISGLGQVGSHLARMLHADGATLMLTDIDPGKRRIAAELDATWIDPLEALTEPTDVFVPAAVGGVFTKRVIENLRCGAVVGPANNQLADDDGAAHLAARGILWAPDFVANAGGALHVVLRDVEGMDAETVAARVRGIRDTVEAVFCRAERDGGTPLAAAQALAAERLARPARPASSVVA